MSNPPSAGRPASPITFGGFKMAQALGTRQALLDAGRLVILPSPAFGALLMSFSTVIVAVNAQLLRRH